MKCLNFLVVMFFVVVMPYMEGPVSGQPDARSSSELTLRKSLYAIGDKYDCYFTLEIALESGNQRQSLEGQIVSPILNGKSLRKELDGLTKRIPYLQYRFDAYNPKIIHIIDAHLSKEHDYSMDKIISEISFDGIGFDLVNELGRKGGAVSSKGPLDISEGLTIDLSSQLRVRESDKSIRNIVTNSLPLQGRGRILWIAQTEMGAGAMTYIRFLR
jgi:hypothetical protein